MLDKAARAPVLATAIGNFQHCVEKSAGVGIGEFSQLLAAELLQLRSGFAPPLDEFSRFFVGHIVILLRFELSMHRRREAGVPRGLDTPCIYFRAREITPSSGLLAVA